MHEAWIRIHPDDHVAVALRALLAGTRVCGVTLKETVPAGHKAALVARPAGAPILKYGCPIGIATRAITPGEWVHTHNCRTGLTAQAAYRYAPQAATLRESSRPMDFQGYLRPDGCAGIRNEVWILPTVGCVNHTAQRIAERARACFGGRVDGIWAYPHPYGCSQLGDDLAHTQATLAALARHPNVAAALILGLGCENNSIGALRPYLGDLSGRRVAMMECQGEADEEQAALALLDGLTREAAGDRRVALGADRLVIGLKCGGSDGFSGITANPLVGMVAEAVISAGGTALLTEVPEMFGAEQELLNRCVNRAIFDRAAAMIQGYKDYFVRHGQPVYENPSPGNREGGITTLEEKSLGCTQKGGRAPVSQVIHMGETAQGPGLALVDGPGNDLCAVTTLACAGAQLVLFTTGRGTPLCGPTPTLKIATHSELARSKPAWIDFDAGVLLEGADGVQTRDALLDLIRCTANGTPTQGEQRQYREIAIFKDGVTL